MSTFTTYFNDEMCAECRDGEPIVAIGHRARLRPSAGDTVVIITVRDRAIHVLAALEVQRIERDVEPLAYFCPDYGDAVVTRTVLHGKPIAVWRTDRLLTPEQLRQWVYESPSGPRPIKGLEQYRPNVRTFARVTPETAAMLDRVLGRGPAASELPSARRVEEKLRDSPEDEALARVLADAWQGESDPRGELLALELALRHEADLERVAAIDARVCELARKKRDLRNRPGGFPFRSVWGTRELHEFEVRFGHTAGSLEAALAGVEHWIELEGASKLLFDVQRLPHPVEARLQDLGGSQGWVDRPYGRSWEWRRKPLRLEPLRPWLLEYPVEVTFCGRARFPGTQVALPLLAPAAWRGPPPRSEATLRFSKGVSHTVRVRLRVPVGLAIGATLQARLPEELAGKDGLVRRRRLSWGPHAPREPSDGVDHYGDPAGKRIMDPLWTRRGAPAPTPRERDGPHWSLIHSPSRW